MQAFVGMVSVAEKPHIGQVIVDSSMSISKSLRCRSRTAAVPEMRRMLIYDRERFFFDFVPFRRKNISCSAHPLAVALRAIAADALSGPETSEPPAPAVLPPSKTKSRMRETTTTHRIPPIARTLYLSAYLL